MNFEEFTKVLRTRWLTVWVTTLVVAAGALTYSLLTTPLYQASTRLFVSTSAGASLNDLYQGNRFSQERVLSYAELIEGKTLVERTIDKLNLDMTAATLQTRIKATSKTDTVLIDVRVRDESPTLARDIANSLSDEFVAMVRELETPDPGGTPDARVIVQQRAEVPDKPVVPQTSRNVAIGIVAGIFLGIGLAVLRTVLDKRVKDQATLEDISGVSVIGVIPVDKQLHTEPAINFDNNNSATAEAFRKLRTNLQFLSVENPPRVIVVTSSLPKEGKSVTAINIALVLAEIGYRVVLVDGDLRRSSLARYLKMVEPVGFSTVLSGQTALSQALKPTRFPRLTVLTAGATPPNPSELLGSMAAGQVIKELRHAFDFVIVDSSPLLAVTDAAILSAEADATIIAARFAGVKRDQLAHAVAGLADIHAPLLGAVLTLTPPRDDANYSYDGYGYYTSIVDRPRLRDRVTNRISGPTNGPERRRHRRPS